MPSDFQSKFDLVKWGWNAGSLFFGWGSRFFFNWMASSGGDEKPFDPDEDITTHSRPYSDDFLRIRHPHTN